MKAVTVVLLWLLSSAAAIGVAWSGVGVLDDDLVAPAPAVVNVAGDVGLVSESVASFSDEGSPELSATGSTLTFRSDDERDPDDRDVDDDSDASGSSTSITVSPSTTATTSSAAGSQSTATTPTTSSTTSTTRNASTSSTTGTTNTTTSTASVPDPEPYETKTFTLIGGATAIKFSPSGTKVLWATPNPGYEVRVEPEYPGVKVEFRSDDHRSRVDAWWDNGPRHEIREDD